MATLTLRILTNSGDITKGSTLSSAELDQNLISLNNEVKAATSDIATIETDVSTLQTDVSGKVSKTGDTISGNIEFTGTGRKITADFSNATYSNRLLFQSSTTNGNTFVGIIPNGTATSATYQSYGTTDLVNSHLMEIGALSSEIALASNKNGTGTYMPITFYTGGFERVRINTSGAVGIGSTPSTADKLEIVSSGSTAPMMYMSGDGTGDGRRFIQMYNTNTSMTTQSAIVLRTGASSSLSQYIKAGTEYTTIPHWTGRTVVVDDGAGVYITASNASGDIKFSTGGNSNLRVQITSDGHMTPGVTNAHDLGSTTLRWRNIYTQDLHLSNGIGDYTVVEGLENLYLVNNKTNKSFKFALIEVDPTEVPEKSKVSDGT